MQQIINALLHADRDICGWLQLAEKQRKELPDVDHLPCGPTMIGMEASRSVLVEIRTALQEAVKIRDADAAPKQKNEGDLALAVCRQLIFSFPDLAELLGRNNPADAAAIIARAREAVAAVK